MSTEIMLADGSNLDAISKMEAKSSFTFIETKVILTTQDLERLDRLVEAMNADVTHIEAWAWTRENVLATGSYLHLPIFEKQYNLTQANERKNRI